MIDHAGLTAPRGAALLGARQPVAAVTVGGELHVVSDDGAVFVYATDCLATEQVTEYAPVWRELPALPGSAREHARQAEAENAVAPRLGVVR